MNNNLQIQREKEAKERRKALGIEIGQVAPEIILKNPEGFTYKLSDLKDQIVLLDFWASWCRPCRAENPNVVKLYEQYNKEGFTVFSVSLDQKLELWEAAIINDRLVWPYHVSDLNGWYSSAATQMATHQPQRHWQSQPLDSSTDLLESSLLCTFSPQHQSTGSCSPSLISETYPYVVI